MRQVIMSVEDSSKIMMRPQLQLLRNTEMPRHKHTECSFSFLIHIVGGLGAVWEIHPVICLQCQQDGTWGHGWITFS